MTWVRLLWSEAGAVFDLGFCALLDRLKGSSPLRSWVLRPGREKGAVPGVCAAARGTRQGCSAGPGSCSSRWWRAGGPRPCRVLHHIWWQDKLRTGTIRSLQKSRTRSGFAPEMNGCGKLDSPIVPAKPPNKAARAVPEVVEERGLGEGNTVRRRGRPSTATAWSARSRTRPRPPPRRRYRWPPAAPRPAGDPPHPRSRTRTWPARTRTPPRRPDRPPGHPCARYWQGIGQVLADSAHLEIVPRGRFFPEGTIKQIRYERGVSRRP